MNATDRLELARKARKAAERELRAEREIAAEKEATYKAQLALARMKLSKEEKEEIMARGERSFNSKFKMAD